jgi:hypothetical protein
MNPTPAALTDGGVGTLLKDRLFARKGEEVYAVVDGARDPSIVDLVRGSGQRYACLYSGKLPPELAAVAPYVVRLWRDHPFTAEWLDLAWGQSWGIFAIAPANLEEMRRHLRRFLRVRTEQGQALVFRYYDPRVLRVYLPTCTKEELATFFGPVSSFFVETEDARRVDVFARKDADFTRTRL